MERVGTLIDKLQDQFEHNAGRDKLLITAQLLMAELQQMQSIPSVHSKISVVLPSVFPEVPEVDRLNPAEQSLVNQQAESPVVRQSSVPQQSQPREFSFRQPGEIFVTQPGQPVTNQSGQSAASQPGDSSVGNIQPGQPEKNDPVKKPDQAEESVSWLFNPVVTIPTLEHQDQKNFQERKAPEEPKEFYELNDVILPGEEESLNDKLKEEKMEVATVLHNASVRDLKKAIGINDRYLFIRELFRSDENMYERSLKTINAFNIYPEAQYWIQRELKVKLGWNERSEAVRLFDQLVRRRFS